MKISWMQMKISGKIELWKLISDWSPGKVVQARVGFKSVRAGVIRSQLKFYIQYFLRMVLFISDTIRSLHCWYTGYILWPSAGAGSICAYCGNNHGTDNVHNAKQERLQFMGCWLVHSFVDPYFSWFSAGFLPQWDVWACLCHSWRPAVLSIHCVWYPHVDAQTFARGVHFGFNQPVPGHDQSLHWDP